MYQKRDPTLGIVYEYHDIEAAHPGRGFERVYATNNMNNNQSVPSLFMGLEEPPENAL